MTTNRMSDAVRHLRGGMLLRECAALTDGQLLECFVSQREEAALEALVRRHAPMVWGVCRRIVPREQDAEDAFQATFLVLVKKASSVVPREMVVNWLFGVARQTALKARSTAAKRAGRERQMSELPEPPSLAKGLDDDLRRLLDEELARLPAAQRVVVLLCEVEGMTRQEAAAQLGVPEGTVASRLARARETLARRLARRGVAPASAALPALLSPNAPAALLSGTVTSATLLAAGEAGALTAPVVSLMEGVVKSMSLTKLKLAAALVAVVATVFAGGVFFLSASTDQEQAEKEKREEQRRDKAAKKGEDAVKQERKKFVGSWKLVSIEANGEKATKQEVADVALQRAISVAQNLGMKAPRGDVGGLVMIYDDEGKWKQQTGDGMLLAEGTSKIDPSKKPKTLDETGASVGTKKQTTRMNVYEFVNDKLRVCTASPGEKRPTSFEAKAGSGNRVLVFERVKKKEDKDKGEKKKEG